MAGKKPKAQTVAPAPQEAFPAPVSWRDSLPGMAVLFVFLFALYAWTSPRQVAMEDDADFVLSSAYLGIAHPPGYPLFVLSGWVFSLLPLGSMAYRVHLASGFHGALACAVLYHVIRRCGCSRWVAAIAALSWGVSDAFWSQSIIAETYTLSAFLFFLLVALGLQFRETGDRLILIAGSFVLGLGLAAHWPLAVVSSPCLLFLLLPRIGVFLRNLHFVIIALALGVWPYLWMIWRSWQDPLISFMGPLDSWEKIHAHLTLKFYKNPNAPPLRLPMSYRWGYASHMALQAWLQFTAVGACLAAAGWAWFLRRRQWTFTIGILLAFLGVELAIFRYQKAIVDYYRLVMLEVFLLIPYGVMAIGIAGAAEAVRRRVATRGAAALLFAAVFAVLPAWIAVRAWPNNNRREYTWALEYGRTILEALEPDAILFVHQDLDTLPVAYAQLAEGIRPDVTIYNDQGLLLRPRIQPRREQTMREAIAEFVKDSSRPVYATINLKIECGIEEYGMLRRYCNDVPKEQRLLQPREELLKFFDKIEAASDIRDPFTRFLRKRVIYQVSFALTPWLMRNPDRNSPVYRAQQERMRRADRWYTGRLARVETAMHMLPNDEGLALVDETMAAKLDETITQFEESRMHYLRGEFYSRAKDPARALACYLNAVEVYPHYRNSAIERLFQHYQAHEMRAEFEALKTRFPKLLSQEEPEYDTPVGE